MPDASVAIHNIVVLPSAKNCVALFVTDFIIPLSVTVAFPSVTTFWSSDVASKVTVEGGVIFGAVVSMIFTTCFADAEFWDWSVAVQVTVVLPSGNTAGASLATDFIIPLSVTVAFPRLTTFAVGLVDSCVMSDGA